MIEEHNANEADFKLGVNQFADLTKEEIKAFLKYEPMTDLCKQKHEKVTPIEEINWFTKIKGGRVKNQGNCGSCWAFSAIGAVENAFAIKNNADIVELSEQELVDCSRSYGNEGCNGGDMDAGFKYIMDKGISLASEYKYEGRDGACRKKSANYKLTGCVQVKHDDGDELLEALTKGPVSIAVKADNSAFMYYRSGIITKSCGTDRDELDHGITLVGAGIDKNTNTPFWIAKNSWGSSWGESGFVKIKREAKGHGVCGINMDNAYPLV
jgi:C1A family cysteine protease